MTALDTCTNCNENETCIPEVPGCKIDGCGSPVVSSGTVVVGNDFKVEARLKYACATGYSNNGSSLITCESNGQWSSLDACTQDASQCPLTTNYQTTKLSDHTNFKYWLVRGNSLYTQAEGAALCQTCQGKLVEILTTAKLTFLRYILTMQAEDIDYWVDGSNAGAANFSSHDSWTTASGAIIPFDIGLWAPGKPDLLDVQHCIRLRPSSGYYFDNKACGVLYRVICEQ
ncbi:uncharacterized protein LOC132723555 [Ruditapes philippinarum]|uniref:uncharacterized protein LOC132723555 n=1 Tax=Ruditapes philippinarum TaxID=129788 RepID=UPI00295C0EBA|nr:uncharacterized protein LOC132723555 [Ruditapes philippinarum]